MTSLVQPTRILIVGGGGREHALAWKLAAEPGVNEVVVMPGSDGIGEEARVQVVPTPILHPGAVIDVCRTRAIELVVIGPEGPLADGLADDLRAAGITVFGPSKAATRIESSKAFCHEVAAAAGVPMADSIVCRSVDEAMRAINLFARSGRGFVIKEDGLAAGKGVAVHDAGDAAWIEPGVANLFDSTANDPVVVVEERLEGREASLIVITDGVDAAALPAARDHKQLLDGDTGGNTGGMGAYSPLPDLSDGAEAEIVATFHLPVIDELRRRGTPFIGALYAGLILTRGGPVLLEFNARFGDPETQVLMPRVATPLAPLLRAAARGELGHAMRSAGIGGRIPTTQAASVGVVLAAERYPAVKSTGDPIVGIDAARSTGGLVFHAGTRRSDDGSYATDGGRILTVVGQGRDLADARERAERAADAISWPGMQRRHDIALSVPEPAGATA